MYCKNFGVDVYVLFLSPILWKFPGDFPGTSLTVDFESNPEAPRPDLLRGQPPSLGSLTRSEDSQNIALNGGTSAHPKLRNMQFPKVSDILGGFKSFKRSFSLEPNNLLAINLAIRAAFETAILSV